VANNPIASIDPYGRYSCDLKCILLVGVISFAYQVQGRKYWKYDKYTHCRATCELVRICKCSAWQARTIMNSKEILDALFITGFDIGDYMANYYGSIYGTRTSKTCHSQCKRKYCEYYWFWSWRVRNECK
jgi:hypothetical protein